MRKISQLVILVCCFVIIFNKVSAEGDVSKAEALFIYNFTRYVEWPAQANNSSFVIYVYGSAQVFSELKEYTADKMVGTQPITLKKISSIDEIDNCNLIFVAFSKTKDIKAIKSKLNNNKTLIITERAGALEEGSIINFVFNEDKLGYEINPTNASNAGLKLNSVIINYAKKNKS